MKKITLSLFLILFTFTSCLTSGGKKEVKKEDLKPEKSMAYLYGKFDANGSIKVTAQYLLFRSQSSKDIVKVKLEKGNNVDYKLIPIKPGIYKNDFSVYMWDVFYWYKHGSYTVNFQYQKPIKLEAGKIYYVGDFAVDKFNYRIDAASATVYQKYPIFAGIPMEFPYKGIDN